MVRKKLKITRSKHEALLIMRAIEAADADWRDRIQSWLAEAKEAYRIGFQKVYESWLSIRKVRLKTEPDQIGTVDIMFDDPLRGNWQIISVKTRGPYRPEVLFSEIKS
jgi:hypothetical protein